MLLKTGSLVLSLLLTFQAPLFAIDNMETTLAEPTQETDYRSIDGYTCDNNYSASEKKVVKTIHSVLETYGTQLDTMSSNEMVQTTMKKERERVVNMTEAALTNTGCYGFEVIMGEIKEYASMIPASKTLTQDMLNNSLVAAKNDMLVLQSHLLSQYDDYKAFEKAISNTVDLGMKLSVEAQNEFALNANGILSMQNIINIPGSSLQSAIRASAKGEYTHNMYDRETQVSSPITETFGSSIAGDIIVKDTDMYIKPTEFVLGSDNDVALLGEKMVQKLIEKLNGAYIKIGNDELDTIDRDFAQIAELSLWKQLQVYKTLKEKAIFDYYHTEGNTSYGVIGEGLCEIVGIINGENDRSNPQQECLDDRMKMLLATNGKGLFSLTTVAGQTTRGITDTFATTALKEEINSDEFSSINLNTTILGRNNDRINTVSLMLPSESEEITQNNMISYAYPNLSILFNEENEGVSIKINGPITQDNIDLKGSLTVINDRSDEKTQGDMTLSMTKQNNTYNGSILINGQVSNTETQEKYGSFSLELTNTKTVSTTNVPSITIPQKTISVDELEKMTNDIEKELGM